MHDLSKRRPPAFQLYASDTLADRRFLLMSAAERGLLMSMRMACWVSDEIPPDPPMLARVLGLPVDDVAPNLSRAVLDFFAVVPGDSGNLHDPELDAQRDRLRERRDRQAEGGAKGAKSTNANKPGSKPKPSAPPNEEPGTPPGNSPSTPASTPTSEPPGSGRLLSRAEQSGAEQSGTPSLEPREDEKPYPRDDERRGPVLVPDPNPPTPPDDAPPAPMTAPPDDDWDGSFADLTPAPPSRPNGSRRPATGMSDPARAYAAARGR